MLGAYLVGGHLAVRLDPVLQAVAAQRQRGPSAARKPEANRDRPVAGALSGGKRTAPSRRCRSGRRTGPCGERRLRALCIESVRGSRARRLCSCQRHKQRSVSQHSVLGRRRPSRLGRGRMRAGGRGGMPCKTHVLCLLVCRLDDERSECPEEPEMLLDAQSLSLRQRRSFDFDASDKNEPVPKH